MRSTRAGIVVYMGLVFSSGAVLGALGHRLYTAATVSAKVPVPPPPPKPEEFRKRYVSDMQSRLKLTDQQVVQLNAILDEDRARVEETRQKMKPAYQKIHDDEQAKIRKMLTPEQETERQKMVKERQEERQERQRQTGRAPGPGF